MTTRPVSAGASWRRTDSTSGSSGIGGDRSLATHAVRRRAPIGRRRREHPISDVDDALAPRPDAAAARARAPGRDRDDAGRPEQARPRDRTGRPLPYDTDLDRSQRTEEHDYGSQDEALSTGLRLWSEHRFFEAHECLEDVWHQATPGDREFWKGVIQVAVGCVHDQRGNPDGAVTLLRRAADYLDPYPSPHHGIDTDELRRRARAMADQVDDQGTGVATYPTVPTTSDGAFVGARPGDGPHPLRDEPAWRRPPRGDDATTAASSPDRSDA